MAEGQPDSAIRSLASDESKQDNLVAEPSYDRLSMSLPRDPTRQPTPTVELRDDPMKFENAKQKKTTLLEGIKKFNTKPKRVCVHC